MNDFLKHLNQTNFFLQIGVIAFFNVRRYVIQLPLKDRDFIAWSVAKLLY